MVTVWDLGGDGRLSERFRFPIDGRHVAILAVFKNLRYCESHKWYDSYQQCGRVL